MFLKYLLTSLVALVVLTGWGNAVPTRKGNVSDYTNHLTIRQERYLYDKIEKIKNARVVIAIVSDMGGETIEDYAQDMFSQWGIGSKKEDNGVLILMAMKERKIRIHIGYGVEAFIPDHVAKDILSKMTPMLKAGNYYDGFVVALDEISRLTMEK